MHGKYVRTSVRAPQSRPIEIYGQDGSVFSQYSFPSKIWFGPNQEGGLHPKSLGEGLMISAFVSRDTGFVMPIHELDLQRINAYRQGKDYLDKIAALEVHKIIKKQPLTKTPFIRELLIGASKGGFWNSYHMAIQLEDAVDCLKVLRPEFDFVFMFDHHRVESGYLPSRSTHAIEYRSIWITPKKECPGSRLPGRAKSFSSSQV